MIEFLFRLAAHASLRSLHRFGDFIGWCLWVCNSSRRRVALRNIESCFPDWPREKQLKTARESLQHEMKTLTELPLLWLGPDAALDHLVVDVIGADAIDKASAHGKGVIILTLHFGSFEGPAIVFSRDHVITGVYKPQKGAIEGLAARGRSRYKGRLVPAVGGTVREKMLECLRRGEFAYTLPDQDPPTGRGVFVPFFGQVAHTPTLAVKLAQQSGAPVLFMLGERLPRAAGYRMHIREMDEEFFDPDVERATTAMNHAIEKCILLFPEQYWWGYRRFRRQPAGGKDFYAGC